MSFFFSSRRRHTRWTGDWSSDVCSSDLSATLAEQREELGDLLYVLAKLASQDGIDPEEALRAANRKFTERFAALEQIARERGWESFRDRPLEDLESAWAEAKRRVAAPTGP